MTREALAIKYAVTEATDLHVYDFLECVLEGAWDEIPGFVKYCERHGVDVRAPERAILADR